MLKRVANHKFAKKYLLVMLLCYSYCVHVSASVWIGGGCGCACTLEREGGRERRAGVYVSVGRVMICLDFFLKHVPLDL